MEIPIVDAEAFRRRRDKLAAFMAESGVDMLILEDNEARRCLALPYLCGHPMDALLAVRRDGSAVLLPWDANLAAGLARVEEIIPYNDYQRSYIDAVAALAAREAGGKALRVELGRSLPHPIFGELEARLARDAPAVSLVCREDGPEEFIDGMRMIKDPHELAALREGFAVTNRLLELLEAALREAGPAGCSETDAALLIERESRRLGAQGSSFDVIAAGPGRSSSIHAHPPYGAGPFGSPGLSILDFGVRFGGYSTDVTLSVVAGKPSERQLGLARLVQEAYDLAVSLCKPGASALVIARAVDALFERHGKSMPHSLGHGIGLEVHEPPYLRNRADNSTVLEPGMVITLEPGLYDPALGGVRLENDILITAQGRELLTAAKILHLK